MASLYVEQDKDDANILLWPDDEKGVIFSITAALDSEDLIKIAESVQPKEK